MKCFACAKGLLTPSIAAMSGKVRGEAHEVNTAVLLCNKCGHKSVEGKNMPGFMRDLADAYRSNHGLLTSHEIKLRRERIGMSQKAFAEYLRVGEASVKRWELGQIQDEAMNELILLKTDIHRAQLNSTEVARRLQVDSRGRHNFVAPIKCVVRDVPGREWGASRTINWIPQIDTRRRERDTGRPAGAISSEKASELAFSA
jgi:putative zinc finger/helix-turn-helix YgiT family protein